MRNLSTLLIAMSAGHWLVLGIAGVLSGEQLFFHAVQTVLALLLATCTYARLDPDLPDRIQSKRQAHRTSPQSPPEEAPHD